jgi:hypothetical protein
MASRKKTTTSKKGHLPVPEIGAVAKFSYEKKIREVIPPDVTRAKSRGLLDLFSPLTQWAGLQGDSLYFKRLELRIHQQDALEELAAAVQEKIKDKPPRHPVHPKVLIPALEGASLEGPNSPLLDWWANILVSEAHGGSVRPYHISLMNQLGTDEARFLDSIWKRSKGKERNDKWRFEAIWAEVDRRLDTLKEQGILYDHFASIFDLSDWGKSQKILFDSIELTISVKDPEGWLERYRAMPYDAKWTTAINVCWALSLILKEHDTLELNLTDPNKTVEQYCSVDPMVFVFSALGTEFMLAARGD